MQSTLMTFNVLNAWTPGSAVYKTMPKRSADAAVFVKQALPHILCLQEFDYYYRHDGALLQEIEERYAEADTRDEVAGKGWNCIFYRKDLFRELASGENNLVANGFSIVPIKPTEGETVPPKASNCHKYGYPEDSREGKAGINRTRFRTFAWAYLERTDGKRLVVATMHFSLRSACQPMEVEFVMERLKELKQEYGCPILLCGDFNSHCEWQGSATARLLKDGLLDTFDLADKRDDRGTCHSTSGKGVGEPDKFPGGAYKSHAIDHILTDTPMTVGEYRIYATENLLSVSDHCPVEITFDF